MRPFSVVVFFLLLSLLVSGVQAMRFKKQLFSSRHHNIQEEEASNKESVFKDEVADLCREGNCNTGINRKLLITPTTSTPPTITSKNERNINGDDDQNKDNPSSSTGKSHNDHHGDILVPSDSSSPTSSSDDKEHNEISHHQYVDITDITEMDYSPAKRKPPIHN